jgi:hypothetical protein
MTENKAKFCLFVTAQLLSKGRANEQLVSAQSIL